MTKTTNTQKTIALFATAFTLLSGSLTVFAQNATPRSETSGAGSFVVMPAKIEADLVPGEKVTREILIQNQTGRNADFSLSIEDVAGSESGSGTVAFFGSSTGPYPIRNIISLATSTVSIPKGAEVHVPVTLLLPEAGEPGGHYGAVFVTLRPEGAATGPSVSSRIGVLFFVRMPGNQTENASLKTFATANNAMFFAKGNVPMQIAFENTGNVHVNPYGRITIKNLFGQVADVLELDPWYALPNSLRTREVKWEKVNAFGFYNATLEINRGYEDIIDTKTISFLIIPFWAIAAIIIFVGAALWVLREKFFAKKTV